MLKVRYRNQMMFFHKDNDTREQMGGWMTRIAHWIHNRINVRKYNEMHYPKYCLIELKYNEYDENSEDVDFIIQIFKKNLFNKHLPHR